MHGYYFGQLYIYQPGTRAFYVGKLNGVLLDVLAAEWYEPGGEHMSVGGFQRWSKRYRELTMQQCSLEAVNIKPERERKAAYMGGFDFPGGLFSRFQISASPVQARGMIFVTPSPPTRDPVQADRIEKVLEPIS